MFHPGSRNFLLASLIAALLAPAIEAQAVRGEMLVSAGWLHRRLGMVTVLHIGDAAGYDAGHIPGAALIEPRSLLVQRDGIPNELPPVDALEGLFRAAGVGARERIVVYSNDPLLAARAWFTLDYLGHGRRTSLLDAGLAKWVAAGYATSTKRTSPAPGGFEAHAVPQKVVDLAAMKELVSTREERGRPFAIVDARPPAQFSGDEPGSGVAHAGRIPGAVNVPYASNLDATGALKSVSELRLLYSELGLARSSTNVVYCRTGMQAAMTYYVLRYLGYDVALYDGSFLEWSNAGEIVRP